MGFGDYPIEYNPKVHGPYDPARYYGKPDTPFSQVKLGELMAWIGRRNKSPQAAVAAVSRAWWRYQHKWVLPRRAALAFPLQFITMTMGLFYFLNYHKMVPERWYKYHW